MLKSTARAVRDLLDEQRVLSLAAIIDGVPYAGLLPFLPLSLIDRALDSSRHGFGSLLADASAVRGYGWSGLISGDGQSLWDITGEFEHNWYIDTQKFTPGLCAPIGGEKLLENPKFGRHPLLTSRRFPRGNRCRPKRP